MFTSLRTPLQGAACLLRFFVAASRHQTTGFSGGVAPPNYLNPQK
jgi:hypothetical protein